MTSMPASRSARATIFTPRSWPSSPTLASKTRIGAAMALPPETIYGPWIIQDLPRRRLADFQLEQGIGIAVAELGHVGGRERDAVQKRAAPRVRRIGIVDREHDAVDAEGEQRG